MFEFIEGVVAYKRPEYIAMQLGGLGYRVYISLRNYESIETGKAYRMYLYNHLREDESKLIGFLEEKERKMFELLLSVKGIGVSLALAALSTYKVEDLVLLIQEERIKDLRKIPKLGEKKAQQMILDIQSKIRGLAVEGSPSLEEESLDWKEDIASALSNLGYAKKEVEKLLADANFKEYTSLEEAMKAVLKKIKR